MDRREALRRMVLGSAGAVCVAGWVERLSEVALARAAPAQAAASAAAWTPRVFTPQQNATVIEISELIIPRTDTAGAREARVNQFIDTVLEDAPAAERESSGADFIDAPPGEQEALLTVISSRENATPDDREGVEFFEAIKRLTITGYYTSEVGMREELGDDGMLYFAEKPGCAHPEHRA